MNKKTLPIALTLVFALASCSETGSSISSETPSSETESSTTSSSSTLWNGAEREIFDETMGGHLPPDFDFDVGYEIDGYDYSDREDLLYDYIVSIKTDDTATYSMAEDYASDLSDAGYEDIASDTATSQGRFVYEILYDDGVYVQCQVYLNDGNGNYVTTGNGYMNVVFYSTISDYSYWNEDVIAGYVNDCLGSSVTIPKPSSTGVGIDIYDWMKEYGCVEIGINIRDDISSEYEKILTDAGWVEHFGDLFTNGLWMDPSGEIGLFFGQACNEDDGTEVYPCFYIDVYNVDDSFVFSQQKCVDLFYDYLNVSISDPIPDPTNETNRYVYYDDSYLYYNSYYDYDLLMLFVEGDITSYYEDMLLDSGYLYDISSGFYVNHNVDIYYGYQADYGVSIVEIYYVAE